MIPIEMKKSDFAEALYGVPKSLARFKLNNEYKNSPALKERLAAVGYNHKQKNLRRVDLLVYQEVLMLPEDFWD